MDEVPDSDEEDYLPLQQNVVQTAPAPAAPTLVESSIASFPIQVPSMKDPISSSSSGAPPARPRPRPAYKCQADLRNSSIIVDSPVVNFSSDPPSTLSDRIKLLGRGTSKLSTPDPVSTSSSRKGAPSSEIIDIVTDSEDELVSYDEPKPPGNKKSRPQIHSTSTTSSSSSNIPMPSPNQPAPKRLTKTDRFEYRPYALPPSDPLSQSTTTTGYQPELDGDGDGGSVPPIATLTAAGDTSFEPDSSPSNLAAKRERPKPRPILKLKLKKPLPSLEDQLLNGVGGDRDALMMPPPHVPSTSLVPTLPLVPTMPLDTGSSSSSAANVAQPEKPPKKSRKKQGGEDGEKPAKKPRVKKAKKDVDGTEGAQDKPKKKGKGKEKEKEVFKSAEFIDDDDDDELVTPLDGAPSLPRPDTPMDVDLSESAGNKPISVISIPDSQAEEELVSLVGEKRKRAIEEEEDPARGDGNSKSKSSSVQKKSKKAKTTGSDKETKKKAPAKKAKGRTVISDDEEEVAGDDMVLDLDDPPTVVDLEGSPECPPAQPDSDAENEDPHEKMKPAKKRQSKKAVVSDSEGEEDEALQNGPKPLTCSKNHVENTKQNPKPASSPKKNVDGTPKPVVPSISSRYTIASRTKSTPMAELIRKVNSRPGSPFPASASRLRAPSLGGAASPSTPSGSYSPFNKFSRSALSRIAPLHPNRRTPPPPLPPPPPKPKTKKEKEREERWEEEMIEAVGGWDAWKLLTEEEQKAAKRAKWAHELEGWED